MCLREEKKSPVREREEEKKKSVGRQRRVDTGRAVHCAGTGYSG